MLDIEIDIKVRLDMLQKKAIFMLSFYRERRNCWEVTRKPS